MGQGEDDDILQTPEVPADISEKFFKIDDWISHHLTWTMKSDVSAPVGRIIANIPFGQFLFADQHMFFLPTFSQGIHWKMFTKKEMVNGFPSILALGKLYFLAGIFKQQQILNTPGIPIFNVPKVLNIYLLLHVSSIGVQRR
jgi:hypothetical protein